MNARFVAILALTLAATGCSHVDPSPAMTQDNPELATQAHWIAQPAIASADHDDFDDLWRIAQRRQALRTDLGVVVGKKQLVADDRNPRTRELLLPLRRGIDRRPRARRALHLEPHGQIGAPALRGTEVGFR